MSATCDRCGAFLTKDAGHCQAELPSIPFQDAERIAELEDVLRRLVYTNLLKIKCPHCPEWGAELHGSGCPVVHARELLEKPNE